MSDERKYRVRISAAHTGELIGYWCNDRYLVVIGDNPLATPKMTRGDAEEAAAEFEAYTTYVAKVVEFES